MYASRLTPQREIEQRCWLEQQRAKRTREIFAADLSAESPSDKPSGLSQTDWLSAYGVLNEAGEATTPVEQG